MKRLMMVAILSLSASAFAQPAFSSDISVGPSKATQELNKQIRGMSVASLEAKQRECDKKSTYVFPDITAEFDYGVMCAMVQESFFDKKFNGDLKAFADWTKNAN